MRTLGRADSGACGCLSVSVCLSVCLSLSRPYPPGSSLPFPPSRSSLHSRHPPVQAKGPDGKNSLTVKGPRRANDTRAKHVTVACDRLKVAFDHVPVACEHLTGARDRLTVARDHLTVAQYHLTVARDHLTLARDYLIVARDHLTVARDHLAVTWQRVELNDNPVRLKGPDADPVCPPPLVARARRCVA
eukprot:3916243-Rhodomonas_salina.1